MLPDRPDRLRETRGARGRIMTVGTEDVDRTLIQHTQSLPPREEGQEEIGVGLNQHTRIEQTVERVPLHIAEVTLDVREEDRQFPSVHQILHFPEHVLGPGAKGHFQQQNVGVLDAELRQLVQTAETGEIQHFRA